MIRIITRGVVVLISETFSQNYRRGVRREWYLPSFFHNNRARYKSKAQGKTVRVVLGGLGGGGPSPRLTILTVRRCAPDGRICHHFGAFLPLLSGNPPPLNSGLE